MDALKNFDLDHWWKLMAAVGALIAIASAPVSFVAGFLCGLGLLLFGIGEFSMRRELDEPAPATFNMPAGKWVHKFRVQTPFGAVMQMLGIVLLAVGIYRLLAA